MTERRDSLKTLSEIAQLLEASQPSENPLSHIVLMVKEQMKADVCSLYILEGKSLTLVATEGLKTTAIGKVKMGIHEGLTGLAVEKLQPVIVNEASKHPRFKYFPETGEEKFNSFAAVPLMERGQVVGVLTIQTIESREFHQNEIEILKLIAFQLAGVIHNLVVLESVQNNPLEKRTRHFTGVPVAPGFGIGPAFFLHHALGVGSDAVIVSPDQMHPSKDFDPKNEWKKIEEALRHTQDDLEKLEKKLEKKFSKSESDIFSSHRMILSDKSFLKKIKTVVHEGHTAAAAIHLVVNEYIGEFQKIPDAYLRERATDLEDILQRILENLSHSQSYKKGGKKGRRKGQNSSHDQWEGVLIADNLMPSDTVKLDPERITGIITLRGGSTSHAAILARSMGIPAVMGVQDVFQKIKAGDLVVVDGNVGHIYVNPDKPILQEYEKIESQHADKILNLRDLSRQPAKTQDGRLITLEANVGLFSGLKNMRDFGAQGIGLYRTEFPFMTRKKLPTVEEQVEIYVRVLRESIDMPVTFRLLDAGGDKPVEALGLEQEINPFLGYRSIRLTLSRPELLKDQLRALLIASGMVSPGMVRIMIPMISGLEEMLSVKRIYEEIKEELETKDILFDPYIPLGIMIEVPSAVQLAHLLIHECDFFSIGTNDLIQYTLAVDRNNEKVAKFYEPLHPAVLASIQHVAMVGEQVGKPVSICGELAGDPFLAPLLIGFGITRLSMISSNIPSVKEVILNTSYAEAKKLAEEVLRTPLVDEIRRIIDFYHQKTHQNPPLLVQ